MSVVGTEPGVPWFPPQGGDIALIERCMPGGDPYPIVVCWHHGDQAWWNATGAPGPMPAQPKAHEFRELIVRKNKPQGDPDIRYADMRESFERAVDLIASIKVGVRSDIHHLIQPVIGHIRMFTEGDWETPNREHMEGWIERLRVALAVVDALGDDEARAALASKCGLGYATTPEAEERNAANLRRILGGSDGT